MGLQGKQTTVGRRPWAAVTDGAARDQLNGWGRSMVALSMQALKYSCQSLLRCTTFGPKFIIVYQN